MKHQKTDETRSPTREEKTPHNTTLTSVEIGMEVIDHLTIQELAIQHRELISLGNIL